MKTYHVTVKNINARVAKMTLAAGCSHVFDNIDASSKSAAISKAVKHLFDGCGFMTEIRNQDGSMHGQITARGSGGATNLYGRIYVCVD